MKAKHIPILASLLLAVLPSACTTPVSSINVPQQGENTSGIYTLMVNARLNEHNLVEGTAKAYIVIEGQEHEMSPAPYGDQIYQYEYHMPADRAAAKYYFVIRYDEKVGLLIKHREVKQPDGGQPYTLNVVNRYVLQMMATRGVVGSTVPIVGSGFAKQDYISMGGIAMPTNVTSSNALTFGVMPLAPGDYPVEWHSGSDVFQLGAFHVDMADFKVAPESLTVNSGDSTTLNISVNLPAPIGGLPVTILTDVPASVIMDDVRIPEGQNSVAVPVKGGQPGSGNLRISTAGFNQVTIPITVNNAPPPVVVPQPTPPAVTPSEPLTPAPAPTPAPEPAPVLRGS